MSKARNRKSCLRKKKLKNRLSSRILRCIDDTHSSDFHVTGSRSICRFLFINRDPFYQELFKKMMAHRVRMGVIKSRKDMVEYRT